MVSDFQAEGQRHRRRYYQWQKPYIFKGVAQPLSKISEGPMKPTLPVAVITYPWGEAGELNEKVVSAECCLHKIPTTLGKGGDASSHVREDRENCPLPCVKVKGACWGKVKRDGSLGVSSIHYCVCEIGGSTGNLVGLPWVLPKMNSWKGDMTQ